jgi:hypothetical protein
MQQLLGSDLYAIQILTTAPGADAEAYTSSSMALAGTTPAGVAMSFPGCASTSNALCSATALVTSPHEAVPWWWVEQPGAKQMAVVADSAGRAWHVSTNTAGNTEVPHFPLGGSSDSTVPGKTAGGLNAAVKAGCGGGGIGLLCFLP